LNKSRKGAVEGAPDRFLSFSLIVRREKRERKIKEEKGVFNLKNRSGSLPVEGLVRLGRRLS
jgi:hypothetical protein